MSSKNKDSARVHEKHQTILADLLRAEENKFCADCMAKGPRWASWNLGVFMCIRCAGIHRNLGVHISRVKSVNLDSWTPEQIESIQRGGNGRAKEIYEANLPQNFRRPQDDYAVELFIRNKYERKLYIDRESSKRKEPEKTKEAEKTRTKRESRSAEKKASSKPKTDQIAVLPRPSTQVQRRSPSLQPVSDSLAPPKLSTKVNSAPDLIALDSQHQTPSPTASLDLLTDTPLLPSSSSDPQPELLMSAEATVGTTKVKDNIMSLYQTQPQPSFTAAGYPINAYYYQQQQVAAMRMAQQHQQQHQVNAVQRQMDQLKLQRNQQTVGTASSGGGGGGGQTLNPTLW